MSPGGARSSGFCWRLAAILMGAGWAAVLSPAVEAVELTRGPYVQRGAPDSMRIIWRTSEPADGAVEYGATPAYGSTATVPGPATHHAATLSGLSPWTTYHYRVLANGQPLAEGKTFRTHPDPELAPPPYRFALFGDTGTGAQAQRDVAAGIAGAGADFIIHLGDFLYPGGVAADWDPKYFAIYRDTLSAVEVFPVIGNQDSDHDGGAAYFGVFDPPRNSPDPGRHYSFIYGNAFFASLDSNRDLSAGSAQIAWLDEQLGATDRLWKIVCMHHPIYGAGQTTAPAGRAPLEALFEKHRVDLALEAHLHYYERTHPILDGAPVDAGSNPDYVDPAGTIYVISGGGGGVLRSATPNAFTARYKSAYHHVRVAVDGNELTLTMIESGGAEFDRMTIVKSAPPPPAPPRGDANDDGARDIADAVFILIHLFAGGPAPRCAAAADADDSGGLEITDAVYLLEYLFLGGPAPPALSPEEAAACAPAAAFALSSTAFAEGEVIPSKHTCEGTDLSPPLAWSGAPPGTRSFAITCIDPDAPSGDFIHWIGWNLPASESALAEGAAFPGEGRNSASRLGYDGPCPPRGGGLHRYYFTLHALDVETLPLTSTARLADLQGAMAGKVLGTAVLMGRYQRQ